MNPYHTESDSARRNLIDKQVLALDALSKLSRQFASQPDFSRLIDTLVLTVSGQFSVTNSFAAFHRPGKKVPLYFATGKFRQSDALRTLGLSEDNISYFLGHPGPCPIEDLDLADQSASLALTLLDCGVVLVAPLIHGEKLIGLLGLGKKINGKPYDASEIEFMGTLVNTITPFVANSFLFNEIKDLNAWYLEILDSVKQGVYVFDREFKLRKVNAAGFCLFDRFIDDGSTSQLRNHLSIESVFPDNVFPGWADRLKVVSVSDQHALIENQMAKFDDGERIYNVGVGFNSISGESEIESGLIVTVDDITDQKESEQRLFDLEKLAEKGIMASSIAHELNNFLGMILGGVELTGLAITKGKMEKVESHLEKLKANVAKMQRFTAGLMDYARLETSKKICNVNDIVRDVLSFITIQKKFKWISIQVDLDSNLPDFELDPDQLAQLLLNLMNNAADSLAEANRPPAEIRVETRYEHSLAHLTVRDNGVGMAPDVKERIFKAHLTTKEGGHGYGLVTCNKIVQNHNGEVEIESDQGKGAPFMFRFPIVETL